MNANIPFCSLLYLVSGLSARQHERYNFLRDEWRVEIFIVDDVTDAVVEMREERVQTYCVISRSLLQTDVSDKERNK